MRLFIFLLLYFIFFYSFCKRDRIKQNEKKYSIKKKEKKVKVKEEREKKKESLREKKPQARRVSNSLF